MVALQLGFGCQPAKSCERQKSDFPSVFLRSSLGQSKLPSGFIKTSVTGDQRVAVASPCGAGFFAGSRVWSGTDEGVISVGFMSRDRQPGT